MRKSSLSVLVVVGCGALLLGPVACDPSPGADDAGTRKDGGQDASVDAGSPLALSNLGPFVAYEGSRFEQKLQASGGEPPYSWSLVDKDQALRWVAVEQDGRLLGIAGQPTDGGRLVTVRLTDSAANTVDGTVQIDIDFCKDGTSRACGSETGGICYGGSQQCQNNAFGECTVTTEPSRVPEACGFGCAGCDPTYATDCLGGQCRCGGDLPCTNGDECCINGEVRSCTDVDTSVKHCGGCNQPCSDFTNGIEACVSGTCDYRCEAGWGRCTEANPNAAADCLTNLNTTAEHCGACGAECLRDTDAGTVFSGACAGGSCVFTCANGFDDCTAAPGCETNIHEDEASCGACGVPCTKAGPSAGTATCTGGTCEVECSGSQECSGGCYPINWPQHCGGCGRLCHPDAPHVAAATCSASGTCSGTCDPGWGNCGSQDWGDGCETELLSNNNHCGACGNVCAAGYTCTNGFCEQGCGIGGQAQQCRFPDFCSVCEIEDCGPPILNCNYPCCEPG